MRRLKPWFLAAMAIGLLVYVADDRPPHGALAHMRVAVAKEDNRQVLGPGRQVLTQGRPVPRRERPTRTYRPLPP